jgi:hypothetical protein
LKTKSTLTEADCDDEYYHYPSFVSRMLNQSRNNGTKEKIMAEGDEAKWSLPVWLARKQSTFSLFLVRLVLNRDPQFTV